MGDQIGLAPEAENRLAGIRRLRSPWRSKPASDAPRWLLGGIGFWAARLGLDAAYQRQRLTLKRVRRATATVATSCKRLELEVGRLEQQVGEPDGRGRAGLEAGQAGNLEQAQARRIAEGRLAGLRRQYADMRAREQRLTVACRRLQVEIDAFRAGKEAIGAAYTAAEEAAEVAWTAAEAAWAGVTGKTDEDADGPAGGGRELG